MDFSIFTSPQSNLRTSPSSPRETLYSFSHHPYFSLWPLGITNLLFTFKSLLFCMFHEITHCGFFCLLSFIQHVFKVHPHCSMCHPFFPFYGSIIFHLWVHYTLCIHQLIYMLHVGMCLGTELLGPLTTLFNTWKMTELFPKAAVLLYILTSSTISSIFSVLLFVAIPLFSYACHSGCEVLFHCGCDLHHLNN